jgi:hypothetical protein
MKMPKSFKLFATKIKVKYNNEECNNKDVYGLTNYSTSTITLAKTDKNKKLPKDKRLDSFYHEKVHMILLAMNKDDLSNNESFVDVFSKLLRQSDETAKY